ncbi:MAG: hypothetical protein JRE92_00525 [Deltaproteobacteria bacterium]|nr:hypothetical protein [Deltaproteobacteria bacterium]
MGRLIDLGLRPSGFDPARRVHRSGLKKNEAARIKVVPGFGCQEGA